MSKLDIRIEAEIYDLAEIGTHILRKAQSLPNEMEGEDLAEVTSWVVRLGQLIRRLYGENSQHFESYSTALATDNFYYLHSNWNAHLSQMVGITKTIKHDLAADLLVDFKSLIQADVFADFLEMGEYLLQGGYKDAAAVIIGSVLEDGLRKLAERNKIPIVNETGKSLTIDPLNSELAKREIYTKLIQKQITSWADIRNNAAHGKFGEYSKDHVQLMLLFVQGFTSDYLG